MNPGEWCHRATIQNRTTTNTDGVVSESWAAFHVCWCSVETQGGREFERAQQQVAEMTHLVKTRHYPGVTADMRIKVDGLVLNIVRVENVRRKDHVLRLLCIEGEDDE